MKEKKFINLFFIKTKTQRIISIPVINVGLLFGFHNSEIVFKNSNFGTIFKQS